MSLLARIALRSRASPPRRPPIGTRPFHITSARAALSESDHDQDADDRKATIDHHKDDQLKKQKDGKGHWKRELGSNSESAVRHPVENLPTLPPLSFGGDLARWRDGPRILENGSSGQVEDFADEVWGKRQVKADREEITDAEHDVESLQKETSEALESEHDHAKK